MRSIVLLLMLAGLFVMIKGQPYNANAPLQAQPASYSKLR